MDEQTGSRSGYTRRRALAGGAVAASGLSSGCLNPVKRFLGLSTAEQVSLRIATFPSNDWDERATRITKQLVDRLQTVGIDANLFLLPPDQLRERVLYQRDFDAYVATMPLGRDPDFLRPLLTSTHSTHLGWQNPFGFADMELDELLDRQRRQTGSQRSVTVSEILRVFANEQPFVPLVTDTAMAAIATDTFDGWESVPARDPTWLHEIGRSDPDQSGSNTGTLRVATFDKYLPMELNPLTARLSEIDVTTAFLYDSLGRYYDGAVRPWLAQSWSLEDDELTVRLKPNLQWHDGRSLRPEDVRFTYRFLKDTALGSAETELPAPRFQSHASLVQNVEVVGDRDVRLTVGGASDLVLRVLTAPLLPKHVWTNRTNVVDAGRGLTQAIQTNNAPQPVGCGPLVVETARDEELLRLTRFDDHPLNRDEGWDIAQRFGPLAFSTLAFRITTPANVITVLEEGAADITLPTLRNGDLPEVRNNTDLSLVTSPSRTLYHLGFNIRRRPLRTPKFRRAVAQLLDKSHIAESIFQGYADPISTPMVDRSWVPPGLQWDGTDPEVPFAGSDGTLDAEAARENFREAGFSYTDGGRLVY